MTIVELRAILLPPPGTTQSEVERVYGSISRQYTDKGSILHHQYEHTDLLTMDVIYRDGMVHCAMYAVFDELIMKGTYGNSRKHVEKRKAMYNSFTKEEYIKNLRILHKKVLSSDKNITWRKSNYPTKNWSVP